VLCFNDKERVSRLYNSETKLNLAWRYKTKHL